MSAPPPGLLPADDAAARSFAGIMAILALLAGLAVAAAATLSAGAAEWRAALTREVTVQVLPRAGRDLDHDVARATALANATPGVASSAALSRRETDALIEPWLGQGLDLSDVPAPRLVLVRLGPGSFDVAGLRARLAAELPSARLDDHAGWLASLAGTARALVWGAAALVALVLSAALLAVTFATRGALAANRRTLEVLHWVGADDSFIARAFARRFVRLGLAGSAVGGVAAALVAFAFGPAMRAADGGSGAGQALTGSWTVGWAGLACIAGVVVTLALASGLASHWSVRRLLRETRPT